MWRKEVNRASYAENSVRFSTRSLHRFTFNVLDQRCFPVYSCIGPLQQNNDSGPTPRTVVTSIDGGKVAVVCFGT
jgi:hypothetical protein